jgi:plasmid stabilization system protein ParE
MAQVIRAPAAVRDLEAITDWIAADNLDAALGFYDEVDRLLALITRYPMLGESVEHLGPGMRRRSAITCCSTRWWATRLN